MVNGRRASTEDEKENTHVRAHPPKPEPILPPIHDTSPTRPPPAPPTDFVPLPLTLHLPPTPTYPTPETYHRALATLSARVYAQGLGIGPSLDLMPNGEDEVGWVWVNEDVRRRVLDLVVGGKQAE